MRNQITGGLTLDATALAETIADAVTERLAGLSTAPPQQLTPLVVTVEQAEAVQAVGAALADIFGPGLDSDRAARDALATLFVHGYVLAKHTPQDVPYPAVDGRPDDWFGPTP